MIKAGNDGKRTLAIRVLPEDAPDNLGLAIIDRSAATFIAIPHDVVGITLAPRNASGLDSPYLAAPRLLGEVLQEQRCHGAFETDMDLRHGTVRQGLDTDAEKSQLLIERGDVGLAARQPVEALGHDHVETSSLCINEHPLQIGSINRRRARDRGVLVDLGHWEAGQANRNRRSPCSVVPPKSA
jgi:hypothetical protein